MYKSGHFNSEVHCLYDPGKIHYFLNPIHNTRIIILMRFVVKFQDDNIQKTY